MIKATLDNFEVTAFWTEIGDGNMSYRWGQADDVRSARERVLSEVGLSLNQAVQLSVDRDPADSITVVGRELAGRGMHDGRVQLHQDALITSEHNLALWLVIADCYPVMFYDPTVQRIALAHCGFPSTNLGLAAKVVAKMIELGSRVEDLQVAIGPGIGSESYIYDDNIYQKAGVDWKPYLRRLGPDRTSIDILSYNLAQLAEAGVAAANITAARIDTVTSAEFFSHVRSVRTDEPEARFAAVIALKN